MDRQGLEPGKRVFYYEYDFAKDGGAAGDITLRGPGMPEGFIVTDGKIHVKTAITSGGAATGALKLVSAEDVLDATGKADFSLNAILDVVPVRTAATAVRITTAGTKPVLTVAVAALTAGKFILALEGY